MNSDFNLESGTGLAALLQGNRLRVPLNQREYRWEADNVLDMLQDLTNAMRNTRPSYFMGTVVLTRCNEEEWEIADGQQRLATTTVILCVMRDLFLDMHEEKRARSIEQDFVFWIDPESSEEVARLTLNADDNNFFYHRIVLRPQDRQGHLAAALASHSLLLEAYQTVYKYFEGLRSQVGKGFSDTLLQWRRYLLTSAKVLVLRVPDSTWAFTMFETLNGRGIQTSQVDLVKNHLFHESGKRIGEAQRAWSAMRGIIESIGDNDDLIIEYVRWASCVLYGMTREKEIFDRISEKSQGPGNAITMIVSLEQMANDYAALFNPEHPKWNGYPPDIRCAIKTLLELDVKQMRPLLLSTAKNFTPTQLVVAYKGLISWAVRMTVAGGSKAGRLDAFYAKLAYQVNNREIRNYADLLRASDGTVPGDAEFQSYFEGIRVKVSRTARYYLRCLEATAQQSAEPAWTVNEDVHAVNLEHVMPPEACPEWKETSARDVETHAHRLGNLALLQASENVLADRSGFSKKRPILRKSPFLLTAAIGEEYMKWGVSQIESRQKKLAKLAPTTWPVSP